MPELVEVVENLQPYYRQILEGGAGCSHGTQSKANPEDCRMGSALSERQAFCLSVYQAAGELRMQSRKSEKTVSAEKAITYMGINNGKWQRSETWGGKLVENIVQAFARDCLAESIMKLDKAGYRVVFHVHDEVILDEPKDRSSAQEVAALMGQPIERAPGLPLNADAYECEYYRKD